MRIRIVTTALDPHAEAEAFMAGRTDIGAMVNFIGYCRDTSAGDAVTTLHLEHYPGFSEREIARFAEEICRQCGVADGLIVHRVGTMRPGEPIVLVAVLATHRTEAFEACRLLMDYLKTDAPLWKKETSPGGDRWIEPSTEDRARRMLAERIIA